MTDEGDKPKRSGPLTPQVLAAIAAALVAAVGALANSAYQATIEFRKSENEMILQALASSSLREVCGNLNLIKEARLVEDTTRLTGISLIIDEIKSSLVIGGEVGIDCLPRLPIEGEQFFPDFANAPIQEPLVILEPGQAGPPGDGVDPGSKNDPNAAEPPEAIRPTLVEIQVYASADRKQIDAINSELEAIDQDHVTVQVSPSDWEIANYAGRIWYYDWKQQPFAAELGKQVDLTPMYFTSSGASRWLPMRIWPGAAETAQGDQ